MKKKFVQILQRIALFRSLQHVISAALLRQIIRELHPIKTDKKLIRLGAPRDGGYLVPDDLADIQACFSPGVDRVSDFENDCANLGMEVFLADASVNAPALPNEKFHFRKLFIGDKTEGDFISMDDWIKESVGDTEKDLLLQMDIEGFEYKALGAMSERNIKQFRIILVEFHGLNYLRPSKIKAFKKLLKTHRCVHIHPNNCEPVFQFLGLQIPNLMEFTFLRKDRILSESFRTTFPHPLDADNTKCETLELPSSWYGGNL